MSLIEEILEQAKRIRKKLQEKAKKEKELKEEMDGLEQDVDGS